MYYLQSRYYDPQVCRFINADSYASTGQGVLGHNMFAYCKNDPVNSSDPTGQFELFSFLGAVVGGAIGGTAISIVSYIVGSKLNGTEVTSEGFVNAAVTGAVTGAVGAAIGAISLATEAATIMAKGIASAVVGIGMGIKAGIEAEGPMGERIATGFSTGIITGVSTFAGANIAAYDDLYGFAGNVFTNAAATLFVGVNAEIVSVAATQTISTISDGLTNSTKSPSRGSFGFSNKCAIAIAH